MIDISKCFGKNCRIKDNCLRYKSIGSERQSYFNGEEGIEIINDYFACDNFIKDKTKENIND